MRKLTIAAYAAAGACLLLVAACEPAVIPQEHNQADNAYQAEKEGGDQPF